MFPLSLAPGRALAVAVAVALALAASALPAAAQQHAHTHGHLTLDVAVQEKTITLAIEAPLDSFLGFERAPRNGAERRQVADMVARLKAADRLIQPDPAAGCKLTKVDLESEALGLGAAHGHGHSHGAPADAHADIAMDIVFHCTGAVDARFIDIQLFDAYPRLRSIDVQVAAPQGQFKRSLRPGAARLGLAR